jgi:hypothetical protein
MRGPKALPSGRNRCRTEPRMAERKWGAITSGATFESLATTIVFFEDPKASLSSVVVARTADRTPNQP